MENIRFYTFATKKTRKQLQQFLFPLPAGSGTSIAQLENQSVGWKLGRGKGSSSRGETFPKVSGPSVEKQGPGVENKV